MFANVAEVAWYVTGRFYSGSSSTGATTLRDVGYFIHIQGIAAPLFSGTPSEETALFTFAAAPFESPSIANGNLTIGLDVTGTFRLFLRGRSGASFERPDSFSHGRCIATFARVAVAPTVKIAESASAAFLMNAFTARLVSSEPFELGGSRYDLRDLVGPGVTQWGTAATSGAAAGGVPFVGSALRIG